MTDLFHPTDEHRELRRTVRQFVIEAHQKNMARDLAELSTLE